jgi:glucosamine 6-phosphate synthetase-like amidotransferase/phosphosugar isomerase protein
MAQFLAFAMEFRGEDSWGASNGEEVIKQIGPISEKFYIPKGWKEGIFHTRGASVGAITQKNAHPFVVGTGDKRIIGMHNGSVRNHKELNEKYGRKCEVDSEHIYHQMVDGKPLNELDGKGTMIWYQTVEGKRAIHLARWNFGDLECAELEGNGVVFCSNREPIKIAAAMARVKIKTFYEILIDGWDHVIENGKIMKVKSLDMYKYYNFAGRETVTDLKDYHKCRVCNETKTKFVICYKCIREAEKGFEKVWKGAMAI